MEGLDILLLNCLLWHERDMGLAGCSTYCLGIIAIILLAANKWLHILWADELHLMPNSLKAPCPIKCTRASFDDNPARRDLCNNAHQLIPHDTSLQNSSAGGIHTVQLENILGDINPKCMDHHGLVPPLSRLSA